MRERSGDGAARFKVLPLALLLGLTVVLAGGAIGWGAIPTSSGVIVACFDFEGKGFGKVRLIDEEAGDTCKATEHVLRWFTTAESNERYLGQDLSVQKETGIGVEIQTLDPCGPDQTCKMRVVCTFGGSAISGGFHNIDAGTHLISSEPIEAPSGGYNSWEVVWRNNQTVDTVTVVVNCSY